MRTVFISRELAADSTFYSLLIQRGLEVTGASLIELAPVAFPTLPKADWLFFYSKNGAAFFLGQLRPEDREKIAPMAIAAYGEATAKAIERMGYRVAFTGTGDAAGTAPLFAPLASGKTVLFPRAAHSRHALLPLLSPLTQCIDLVVYNNVPLAAVKIPLTDYAVLTSPLNAISYLKNVTPQAFQRYIAIGETTAEALRNAGIADVIKSEAPTETSLAHVILALEEKNNK